MGVGEFGSPGVLRRSGGNTLIVLAILEFKGMAALCRYRIKAGIMQILTIDDLDFPHLLDAWKDASTVGEYQKNNKVQYVRASNQFVLIAPAENPSKIAIKPARGFAEATEIALRILSREKARGNATTVNPEFLDRAPRD